MTSENLSWKGGTKMAAYLGAMAIAVGGATGVRVGFLEGVDYPESDGSRLLAAADRLTADQKAANPSWDARLRAWGDWANKHHPVKRMAQVAFWNEFGTSTSKPRPYFRNMIASKSGGWGDALATNLRENDFDSKVALGVMGEEIQGDLRDSIEGWPGDNAALTVHIKGFNKALQDAGDMKRAADYEVLT